MINNKDFCAAAPRNLLGDGITLFLSVFCIRLSLEDPLLSLYMIISKALRFNKWDYGKKTNNHLSYTCNKSIMNETVTNMFYRTSATRTSNYTLLCNRFRKQPSAVSAEPGYRGSEPVGYSSKPQHSPRGHRSIAVYLERSSEENCYTSHLKEAV